MHLEKMQLNRQITLQQIVLKSFYVLRILPFSKSNLTWSDQNTRFHCDQDDIRNE